MESREMERHTGVSANVQTRRKSIFKLLANYTIVTSLFCCRRRGFDFTCVGVYIGVDWNRFAGFCLFLRVWYRCMELLINCGIFCIKTAVYAYTKHTPSHPLGATVSGEFKISTTGSLGQKSPIGVLWHWHSLGKSHRCWSGEALFKLMLSLKLQRGGHGRLPPSRKICHWQK